MQILELILVAIGLSMDALAVSICKGLSVSRVQPKHALAVGLYFGGFQARTPLIGYLLGNPLPDTHQRVRPLDRFRSAVR